ncbi:hypothetical protein NLN82_29605, partial [Citrobacter portucalensis]|uniref:hypothetical protein n=1 Tax=Citrobacter portucalensis TaxID=1639133 RepID=UPI00226B238B
MKSCFLFIMNELPFPRENSGITLIDYEILSRKNNDCFFDLLILTKQPNGADYIKLECNLRSVFPNVGNIYFHEVSN